MLSISSRMCRFPVDATEVRAARLITIVELSVPQDRRRSHQSPSRDTRRTLGARTFLPGAQVVLRNSPRPPARLLRSHAGSGAVRQTQRLPGKASDGSGPRPYHFWKYFESKSVLRMNIDVSERSLHRYLPFAVHGIIASIAFGLC